MKLFLLLIGLSLGGYRALARGLVSGTYIFNIVILNTTAVSALVGLLLKKTVL